MTQNIYNKVADVNSYINVCFRLSFDDTVQFFEFFLSFLTYFYFAYFGRRRSV